MKSQANVSYFPVTEPERALLLRVREADLARRMGELLEMVDQIAEMKLSPADLDTAVQLLTASRQGDALAARFENLEARLKDRIERGLAEMEGRFLRRLDSDALHLAVQSVEPAIVNNELQTLPFRPVQPEASELPPEASVAFMVDGKLIWGKTTASFYVSVWKWLFDHNRVSINDLPIQSGRSRYVVARQPLHPSGKEFFAGHEVVSGVWVEANISRADVIRRTVKYLAEFGVGFEIIIGNE
ncbi:MAG: hypothetical protein KGO50_07385 [Myxococcales bacterium]|nr:hypothetical protein [Myxococcales bacterium]